MSDELDDEYRRFFSGQMSPDEEAAFRELLSASGGDTDAVDGLRVVLGGMDVSAAPSDVDASWGDLERRIEKAEHTAAVRRSQNAAPDRFGVGSHRHRRVTQFAAIAAVLIAAAFFLPLYRHLSLQPTGARFSQQAVTVEVPRGTGTRHLLLPDSTRVSLAPASRLSYRGDYGVDSRDVVLEGRAEFVVKHDSFRVFRVHTGQITTEDLGTRFSVTAYPPRAEIRVAVAEGSVGVRRGDSVPTTVLSAGLAAQVDRARNLFVVSVVDADADFGWTSGDLVFHGMRLGEVAAQLSHYYDHDILVADSTLARRRMEVSFNGQSLGQACHALAVLVQARCRPDAQRFILTPRS